MDPRKLFSVDRISIVFVSICETDVDMVAHAKVIPVRVVDIQTN